MENRDLNRLKVVRYIFVSLHKTMPPPKKKTRVTSEGIPSSIDIELLGLYDNPYFTQDFFLTCSSRPLPLPHSPHSGERQNGRACPQDLAR